MSVTIFALLLQGAVSAPNHNAALPPAPPISKMGGEAPATPLTDPGSWVTPADYPPRAMREKREGTTGFILDIGADGLPTGCKVSVSSGHNDLDEQTCLSVQRRAKFTPATDHNGRPVAGSYNKRIRWQIPEKVNLPTIGLGTGLPTGPRGPLTELLGGTVAPDDPFRAMLIASPPVSYILEIGKDGIALDCRVVSAATTPKVAQRTCEKLRLVKFAPARDIDDQPTLSRFRGIFLWRDGVATKTPSLIAPRMAKNPFVPGKTTLIFTLGVDGTMSNCTLDIVGINPFVQSESPCDSNRLTEPFRDADGNPIARDVSFTMTVDVGPAKDPNLPSATPVAD